MVVLLPVQRLDLAGGKGQVGARDGQHLALDPPAGERLQGRHLPGGDHHVQLGRRVIHQPLHQPADLGHVVHQVVVVQDQGGFLVQAQGQRVQQRRQGVGCDAAARALQDAEDRLAYAQLVPLERADKVGQKEDRIAVRLGDRVPGKSVHRAGQGRQRSALAIAGAGLDNGQGSFQHRRQAFFQARTAHHTSALLGRDQLAPDHQIVEAHGPSIIAQIQ